MDDRPCGRWLTFSAAVASYRTGADAIYRTKPDAIYRTGPDAIYRLLRSADSGGRNLP